MESQLNFSGALFTNVLSININRSKLFCRIALFCFLPFFGVSTAYGQFEIKLGDELFISKLNDNVFVATHYLPWESNSLVVIASEEEIVLIDTPYDYSGTAQLMEWVKTTFSPHKIVAINTGFHNDNLGGNQLLREMGIDVYGSTLTCELIDERGQQTMQQIITWLTPEQSDIKKIYENTVFVEPNKQYDIEEGLTLTVGQLDFIVYFPGQTHSPDNQVVYIPSLNLLFGGCMVKSLSSTNLGFTGDANLEEWPKSMRIIQQKFKDSKVVIPHHGMWGDMELVQHTIDLLEKL